MAPIPRRVSLALAFLLAAVGPGPPRPRPFQGRALPSNALGLAHAHARGSASWERGLSGDWWAVTQRLGQRAGGQRGALRFALSLELRPLGFHRVPSGQKTSRAPGCGAGSPLRPRSERSGAARREGVGSFDLGRRKALNLLIVVV